MVVLLTATYSSAAKKKDKDKKDDDNIFKKYEPKEDYQVLQAVNYLRTFQVYKRFESAKVEVKK